MLIDGSFFSDNQTKRDSNGTEAMPDGMILALKRQRNPSTFFSTD
jgi:hypothetical protein